MKKLLTISIFLFNTVFSFSQGIFSLSADTIDKMQSYLNMIKEADHYELISEMELQKINFLKVESHRYIDSASVVMIKAEISKTNEEMLIKIANGLYKFSSFLLQKADSIFKVATMYKDTACQRRFEADQCYMNLAADFRPVIIPDTFCFTTYIVLIGTKDVRKYLDNISDFKYFANNDGEQNYIIGQFETKDAAMKYSHSIARLGYADTYIKSLDVVY